MNSEPTPAGVRELDDGEQALSGQLRDFAQATLLPDETIEEAIARKRLWLLRGLTPAIVFFFVQIIVSVVSALKSPTLAYWISLLVVLLNCAFFYALLAWVAYAVQRPYRGIVITDRRVRLILVRKGDSEMQSRDMTYAEIKCCRYSLVTDSLVIMPFKGSPMFIMGVPRSSSIRKVIERHLKEKPPP